MPSVTQHHLPTIILGTVVAVVSLAAGWLYLDRQKRRRKEETAMIQSKIQAALPITSCTEGMTVANVSSLHIYPVKSCEQISLEQMEITKLGPKLDRQFVLVNEAGNFMTLRRYPRMVLIKQTVLEDGIVLEAPGMDKQLKLPLEMSKTESDETRTITVFRKEGDGVHVSDEADEWFAKFLQVSGCRLYCMPKDGTPRCTKVEGGYEDSYTTKDDVLAFADGCPLLVLSEESVQELNKSLMEPVTSQRFRANVVLTGCQPYEEDEWKEIHIGNTILKRLFPCGRCIATTVNEKTGEKNENKQPLETIKVVRANDTDAWPPLKDSANFGCNYGVVQTGTIKAGDPVIVYR